MDKECDWRTSSGKVLMMNGWWLVEGTSW